MTAGKERYDLLHHVKNKLGTINTAIELGVQLGDHALLIDEIVKPEKLYLLDAFGMEKSYAQAQGASQEKCDICKRKSNSRS